ncbi:MAG: LacI family DNA-binding transcriptional regulator [Eubacteriales bacterium]|nr:LacI family DNA-binding transcriptional regulator [Eubacteriales bacterium]MDD3881055.1 LacI family DNA-binding transcriptional regulator [Eubacteriales bacterium]MDD4511876.1 LacI family DNA-binding transcriptional regulator [Eubacteriales bacterium]
MAKKVTMKNIADQLRVSTVTVSKALGGKDGVGKELRQEIQSLAEQLGYQYSAHQKSGDDAGGSNIGILIASHFFDDKAFYANIYRKIVTGLSELGYYAILEIVQPEDEAAASEPSILQNCKVDAFIVLGQMKREYIDALKAYDLPCLLVDFYNEHFHMDALVSDSYYGSYLLTSHLINMGHRSIGFLGSIRATSSILDRYMGYRKALLEAGIEEKSEWLIEDRSLINGMLIPFELPEKLPTAFVCNCDEVAYILVRQLWRRGIRVPDDISVVGFDDFMFATLCNPPLTTFAVDLDAMTRSAIQAITHKIKNPSYSIGRVVIGGRLVLRDSVKELK